MNAVAFRHPPAFRPMREDDLPAVLGIERVAYRFPWSPGIFQDCLHVGYSCWVMTVDDRVAGYGILSVAAGECHVLNVCVSNEYQGAGLGRAIMEHLVDVAADHGAELILLEVRPSNRRAVKLYRGLGFSEVGRRRAYYPDDPGREDALVLARRLEK